MYYRFAAILTTAFITLTATVTGAAPLVVSTYDTLNGNTGTWEYWDQIYSPSPSPGCTTTNNCSLFGGKGDLTDGIIATTDLSVGEAPPGNGPWVGWTLNPTITFHFTNPVFINSATFYLEDRDGGGGVDNPSAIVINAGAFSQTFNVPEPPGTLPFAFTTTFGPGVLASSLSAQLIRQNTWVFLSEVTFDGQTVPEPSSVVLLASALAGVAATRRRKSKPLIRRFASQRLEKEG